MFYGVAACNSQPCQNNGTCIELDDGFRCECSVGVGLLCEGELFKGIVVRLRELKMMPSYPEIEDN